MGFADYVILAIVLLLLFFAVRFLYRNRKNGCSGCSGSCDGCSHKPKKTSMRHK